LYSRLFFLRQETTVGANSVRPFHFFTILLIITLYKHCTQM